MLCYFTIVFSSSSIKQFYLINSWYFWGRRKTKNKNKKRNKHTFIKYEEQIEIISCTTTGCCINARILKVCRLHQ